MRLTIAAIIIWAVLLGCVLTGVKVMATSPDAQTQSTITTVEVQDRDIHPSGMERSNPDAKFVPYEGNHR
jgi:hypothetical protein